MTPTGRARPGHDAHAAAGRHDHVVAGLVAVDPHRRAVGPQLSLRPDLVTFPVAAISASSVVPSSIALYINGCSSTPATCRPAPSWSTRSRHHRRGPGHHRHARRVGAQHRDDGAVVRGHAPLARGLSSYSVEAGFVRRRFSVRSFDYDHAPAVSASGRYGLDDALTLEGHAESAPGVYNLGAARWSGWARRAWSALRWPAARAVTRAARPAWATSTCGLSSA